MNRAQAAWSDDRRDELLASLTGYWAENIWDMPQYPAEARHGWMDGVRFLKFTCPSVYVNAEFKFAYRQKIAEKRWTIGQMMHEGLSTLMAWAQKNIPPTTPSLLARSLHEWESSLRAFLIDRGKQPEGTNYWLARTQELKPTRRKAACLCFFRQIYKKVAAFYDTRNEYEKDVWDLRILGPRLLHTHCFRTLNFTGIHQPWLRQAAKIHLRFLLTHRSSSTCQSSLGSLHYFSEFLHRHHPLIEACQISRPLLIEYFSFLNGRKLSAETIKKAMIDLRTFFRISAREGWSFLPKEEVIYDEDFPRSVIPKPRYIPDEILQQIFTHLNRLDPHFQRMFVVGYEVGLRIGELLEMRRDCLIQDAAGGWFIRFIQHKMKREHTQPIPPDTAAVIQMQQADVAQQFGDKVGLLFPTRKGNVYSYSLFSDAVNRLIRANNIRDSSGQLWRFQAHQLRHTFGTRLINSGVPQHIVMRLLGHQSPVMTTRYAHLHDATLKAEFEKSLKHRKLVDISGRVLTPQSPTDSAEFQFLKQYVDARTLPNGYCAIPLALSPCPHPNSCITCPHFRTDQGHLEIHERQLAETQNLIQIARAKGYLVQAENNERIAHNLQNMIASLKENPGDSPTKY